jgi:hypothetical protein
MAGGAVVKYTCSTPREECGGAVNGKMGSGNQKFHSSITEAKRCFVSYLIRSGWIRDKLLKNVFRKVGEPTRDVG